MLENAWRDFFGKTVAVGDKIVYPWRHGSSMGLKDAIVLGIYPTALRIRHGSSSDSKYTSFYSNRRFVIVFT